HLHRARRQAADGRRLPAAGAVADRAEDRGWRQAAHLDVRREPDAEPLRVARGAAGLLLLAHCFVTRLLEREVEAGFVVAGVDRQARRDLRRKLPDEVQPANLNGILADLPREGVGCT